ncbi:MAG: metal ABC transporter ATP-binding protein [Propionibacteriaceae bacterium]
MSIPLIEATDLSLSHGDHVAVATSSVTIAEGGITAVIGPNGSGKSTFLHALAGLLKPTSGTLLIKGTSPANFHDLSYVLQHINVPQGIPLTVREAVGMGRYPRLGWFRLRNAQDRRRVEEAMAEVDITDLATRHLGELSGGQRQRVHVAQGLAQDHSVLLLDEPLTGLDVTSAQTIDRIIHAETARGCSVIMTTHDLAEAHSADHVILMSGKIFASGTPKEVLTSDNLRQAYRLGALHKAPSPFFDDPEDHHHS